MGLLYIAIAFIMLSLVYKLILLPNIRFKNLYAQLKIVEDKGYCLSVIKNRNYDFTIENEAILMLIKVINIPSNSSITINSKDTWNLQWGGNPNNKGRAYPHSRYVDEVKPFIHEVIKREKKVIKLILLYQGSEKIMRYINESELEMVTSKDCPYGYKVTNYQSFVQDFTDLINIK